MEVVALASNILSRYNFTVVPSNLKIAKCQVLSSTALLEETLTDQLEPTGNIALNTSQVLH
jgi:hypothetical protein